MTFQPLCWTAYGRQRLLEDPRLRPYTDASCRREPDLEHGQPAITAICRGRNFAPRLRAGNRAIYLTRKARYPGYAEPCWGLVAALRIVEIQPSHAAAADWYTARALVLPGNLMVPGSTPKPVTQTGGYPKGIRSIQAWDGGYRHRAGQWPSVAITKHILVCLSRPAIITRRDLVRVFKKVPSTQTPPGITAAQFDALLELGRRARNGRLCRPAASR